MNDNTAFTSPAARPETYLSIDAIEAWQPDYGCSACGDEHAALALRAYAAAGLANAAIAKRMRLFGPDLEPLDIGWRDAALALARHGAVAGASARQIVLWLVYLADEVPAWPSDPDEIAAIVRGAIAETDR